MLVIVPYRDYLRYGYNFVAAADVKFLQTRAKYLGIAKFVADADVKFLQTRTKCLGIAKFIYA